MIGPAKNRLPEYEAGRQTLLVELGGVACDAGSSSGLLERVDQDRRQGRTDPHPKIFFAVHFRPPSEAKAQEIKKARRRRLCHQPVLHATSV